MDNRLIITDCRIFDGESPDLIDDHSIVVEGGRITAVMDVQDSATSDDVFSARGAVVMPGFIDAHFHAYATSLDFGDMESQPKSYIAPYGAAALTAALRRGFTTVRDVGGADHGLWKAAEQGLFLSPRLFWGGRALSQTGGHGDSRPVGVEPCGCGMAGNLGQIVDGIDEIRKSAREILRHGAHHLKVMISGGIASPSDPIWMVQYSNEEVRVVVEEATRRRKYVAAHAYGADAIRFAIACGVRTIEHANLIDADAANKVEQADAYVVPTLAIYTALQEYGREGGAPATMMKKLERVAEQGLAAIEICEQAGVSLGFGTDLLGKLQDQQLTEFKLRAEVQSPVDVLRSATSVNARIVGQEGLLGCIRPGAFADLVVAAKNPLDDINALSDPFCSLRVMKGGQWVN